MNWLLDRPWLRALALAATVVAAVFLLWRSDEPPVMMTRQRPYGETPNQTVSW